MKPTRFFRALIVISLFISAPCDGWASENEVAELKAMVEAMQKTIAVQNSRIAALENQQARANASVPPKSSRTVSVGGLDIPIAELPGRSIPREASTVRDADTFADQQKAAPRLNNVPLDPKLKGFIAIPGTETIFKIGGSARVDAITDLGVSGNPNQFVPSSIPVPGESGWDGGPHSALHSKGTRLSLELRRPVAHDDTLRVYSEYDFFYDPTSNAMKLRVRHFYGQAWNFLIGQTFSAFMDVDVFPDVADYIGPNGIVNKRQPQIRYTLPVHEGNSKVQVFASVEQPDSRIDTATEEFDSKSAAVNRIPDGVLGLRWEGSAGHLQGAALFRQLSFDSDKGASGDAFGWGGSLSAALHVLAKDKLSAQVTYGEGIARYINDLGSQNLDAALEGGGLDPIPAFATMAGYTHVWNDKWRSTISGGYVHADSPASLGGFAFDNTLYGSVNLMWHATPSFRMGLEYLYGRKETFNGATRDAQRLDFVVRYDLVR